MKVLLLSLLLGFPALAEPALQVNGIGLGDSRMHVAETYPRRPQDFEVREWHAYGWSDTNVRNTWVKFSKAGEVLAVLGVQLARGQERLPSSPQRLRAELGSPAQVVKIGPSDEVWVYPRERLMVRFDTDLGTMFLLGEQDPELMKEFPPRSPAASGETRVDAPGQL